MDIGATIEQKRDHLAGAADDRAVERVTSGPVDVADERRIGVEK